MVYELNIYILSLINIFSVYNSPQVQLFYIKASKNKPLYINALTNKDYNKAAESYNFTIKFAFCDFR